LILLDANFLTTSPDKLDFLNKQKKAILFQILRIASFETLNNFENNNCSTDVFYAISHGVHRGVLKEGKVMKEIFYK
jgi:hypothetical protein